MFPASAGMNSLLRKVERDLSISLVLTIRSFSRFPDSHFFISPAISRLSFNLSSASLAEISTFSSKDSSSIVVCFAFLQQKIVRGHHLKQSLLQFTEMLNDGILPPDFQELGQYQD